jgi:hypothetical protein
MVADGRGVHGSGIMGHLPQEGVLTMGLILLIVLIVLVLGAVPAWPHSRSWGYGPSGGLGLVLVIVLVLLLLGYLPRGF